MMKIERMQTGVRIEKRLLKGSGEQWNSEPILRILGTGHSSRLHCVSQRAQFTTGDGFGHCKRVASEHVDVLVAER